MSVCILPGLKVRIEQYDLSRPPMPLSLDSGFNTASHYEVLGCHNPSETSECYFLLVNDHDQLWWISQRHLRYVRNP